MVRRFREQPGARSIGRLPVVATIAKQPTVTLPTLIDDLAAQFGDAPALLSDSQTLTYNALAERCHRYSRWVLAQGVKPGDVVGLGVLVT